MLHKVENFVEIYNEKYENSSFISSSLLFFHFFLGIKYCCYFVIFYILPPHNTLWYSTVLYDNIVVAKWKERAYIHNIECNINHLKNRDTLCYYWSTLVYILWISSLYYDIYESISNLSLHCLGNNIIYCPLYLLYIFLLMKLLWSFQYQQKHLFNGLNCRLNYERVHSREY